MYLPFITPVNGCPQPNADVYYNYYNYTGNYVSGTVKDQNNNPVENAVVYGWDEQWHCPTQTFTKADGTFELFDNNRDIYKDANGDVIYDCSGNNPDPDVPGGYGIGIIRVSAFAASVINDYPPGVGGTYNLSFSADLSEVVQNIAITSGQTENYRALKSIEMSNITVQSGGNMSAVAGKEIHVGTTTHFSSGGYVHLSIGNIDLNCSDPVNSQIDWKRLGNTSGNSKPKNQDTVILLYPETNIPTAIKKSDNSVSDIEVIPNPANEKFFVILPRGNESEHFEIYLLNSFGKIIYKQEFHNRQVLSFETVRYADGIYFVLIKSDNGYQTVKKIAIQK